MTDMTATVQAKSDQLNADDLIAGAKTIKITDVKITQTNAQQPVAIHYEGDNGKPYKPCLSMRRVLIKIWGTDSKNYIGKSLVLYRDDKVTFGAMAVGGIRISHASDIKEPITLALTASKANKKPYTVRPLTINNKEGEK